MALVLVAVVVVIAQAGKATVPQALSLPSVAPPFFHGGIQSSAIWTVLALVVALVSVRLSMRLASGRA